MGAPRRIYIQNMVQTMPSMAEAPIKIMMGMLESRRVAFRGALRTLERLGLEGANRWLRGKATVSHFSSPVVGILATGVARLFNLSRERGPRDDGGLFEETGLCWEP